MGFVIGIITYKKGDKIQLLESPLIESLGSQKMRQDLQGFHQLLVLVNSPATEDEINELKDKLKSINYPVEIITTEKSLQVPKARNMLLEYATFKYSHSAIFMPDDDDKFFDEWALLAMTEAVFAYGLENPILLSFNGLRGQTMPNNRRVFPNPPDCYQEAAGYFNWNMIFSTDWFISNHISFPEFLDPPHRSHDTIINTKAISILKNKELVFLTNCIMDYKYPEGAGTLSSKTKRPDSKLFDETEYLYSESHTLKVGKKVFFDALTGHLLELSEDDYRGLKFRREDEKSKIWDLIKDHRYLVDFMGRVHENINVVGYLNLNGIDYVILKHQQFTDCNAQYFKLGKYSLIKDMKSENLYQRYISKEIKGDYDDYLYVEVK